MPQGLEWAKGSLETVKGRVGSAWTHKGRSFTWTIEIPANTTARVCIPTRFNIQPPLGNGVHSVTADDAGFTIVEIGSGKYFFVSQ